MIDAFIKQLKDDPNSIAFTDTMAVIDANYEFTPQAFKNGETFNQANENNGSCKLFAFAQLQGFNVQETLQCFGDYYRKDVLEHPDNDDHQNIRNFINSGWDGIQFEGTVLTLK